MKKIKMGMVGLGRLGIQHAENIAFRVPQAELTAVCALEEDKINEVQENWGVPYGYTEYDEMIQNEELDAVFLCSPSSLHCDQIEKALDAGLHVLSEKPLGTTVEECKVAEKAVEKHPDLVFMLAFMRRYDPSYVYAKKMIDEGKVGKPFLYRGYSQDPESAIDGTLEYLAHSGGEFIDMAVHDIDAARWLLDSEPKQAWAIGGCYAYPQFAEYDDGDNVSALMKFENDAMGFLFAGRTAPHGYNVETEIIGTEGILRIGSVPQKNLVEILDQDGVRKECSQDFLERFDQAYVDELQEFVDCIIEDRKPDITVYDGTKNTKIAYDLTGSFQENKLIDIE
ncbi:putative dehydrogenase [Halobacteroides halobius DSM 5150]|uniref:Putative dehydrogenase n=1 Tax=Halobacteroides halobius (strain ATCC 35273 / DSM 5150 / MD-1) TaxID=748449 RepID=L0KCW5_HALHC|nr:inositol 2-dehydrogenase [Halobacteroides halobius]AGB42380.1 putative dehydrogenase [Halobacteroides halobius DSM 5150]